MYRLSRFVYEIIFEWWFYEEHNLYCRIIMSFPDVGMLFSQKGLLSWNAIKITYQELWIMQNKEFIQRICMI